jgi:hypothetical protein
MEHTRRWLERSLALGIKVRVECTLWGFFFKKFLYGDARALLIEHIARCISFEFLGNGFRYLGRNSWTDQGFYQISGACLMV